MHAEPLSWSPGRGSYRARYKQMILAGKEQQNSSLKSMLTWNFAHSYMFSRPELMLALLFQRMNRISVWLFSLAIWICLVCCYITVSCEKKPNMPMGYFAENKMISGVIYVAQCGMVESDFSILPKRQKLLRKFSFRTWWVLMKVVMLVLKRRKNSRNFRNLG